MFTRYTGINIPSNYNGSRFSKSIEDTDTKVHSSITPSTVRSSISPSFERALATQDAKKEVEVIEQDIIDEQTNIDEPDSNEYNESLNQEINNDVTEKKEDKKTISSHKLPIIDDFFRYVKGDDLLLITLIIMLASENTMKNYDTIILLALLLAYHI